MNYIKIRDFDISNGPGISVALFCSGCTNACPGCFNKEAHDFNAGQLFTEDTEQKILELCSYSYVDHLSLLGGDPANPRNWPTIKALVKKFKAMYPTKTVWLWTGYLWEDVADEMKDAGVDVVVDGRFVEELKDLRLKWRGSANQRVISVQESTKDKVVLID